MAIIYLYISLYKRITEIFQNYIRKNIPQVDAMYLISAYEIFILMNFFPNSFITKKSYIVLFILGSFIVIIAGNHYIFEKLYWKIEIPNNKIYRSKTLLNTLFIMFTIWFVYSFYSLSQKVPTQKDEIKYQRPLPPNHPESDSNIQKFYHD